MSDPITTLHYAPNANIVNNTYAPGAVGFNLADISSAGELPYLPKGVEALAWFGMTSGVTQTFIDQVNSYKSATNLFGIYLADEPGGSATIAANLKAESDYIHTNLPGVKTFMVEQNLGTNESPNYYNQYNPANTDIDLFGLDPYPVQTNVNNNLDYGIIAKAVSAAKSIGITEQQIVPIYQAFGGGGYPTYILPTAAQEQTILSTWGTLIPSPVFDYAYSWGVQVNDTALVTDPSLQQVFQAHNSLSASPPSPPPPGVTDVVSIVASGTGINSMTGQGDLNAAQHTVTLTVNFSAPVTVTGSPTLSLDDGGTANFSSSGSPSSALLFTYVVGANQNTPHLTVSSLNLPSGTSIVDGSSNNVDLTNATNYQLAGPLQIDTSAPVVTIAGAGGATTQATQMISGNVDAADASTQVNVFDGSTQVASATPLSGGSWSANITLANGANVITAQDTDAAGNVGTSNAITYTLSASAPTININTIAGNNIITKSVAGAGFSISGNTTSVEDGQTVSVAILNSANVTVENFTSTDQSNAWSVNVTSSQAAQLADGKYMVTANVSDLAGVAATPASQSISVDEERSSEAPTLNVANPSLTVNPGKSVQLGITATPADSDDRISVKISGVPSYERITAPSGDSVSHSGTTYTITQSSSAAGTSISGLTLTSHYSGSGQPVSNLTVTTSDTTSGETATSSSKAIAVTDPSTSTSTSTGSSSVHHATALFTQFVAGFDDDSKAGSGQVTSSLTSRDQDKSTFLSTPHH
ncbi:MAG: hypothetical protein JO188_19795 [Hyphomicrobiales bacterium]|nr:hypothetical protein [Hyphomicrobiales bacterium]